MRPWTRLFVTFAALAAACTAHAAATLKPYRDEAELVAAVQRWRTEARALQPQQARRMAAESPLTMSVAPAAAPAPAPAAAGKVAAESASTAPTADGITNVQTAGVDEGGIVKRAGDHLVVLRRGRLFTVRVGGGDLSPVAMVDAYAPGADPRGAWYDELLVSGRTVVVVGYSYQRGGTEIGLFDLGESGSLTYRATWHLRSNDYYSARNYASRLVGRKLVFYSPAMLPMADVPVGPWMPGVRRWQPAMPADFERVLPATRIYRTDDDFDPREPLALHTVTSCDLSEAAMRCEATAVLGPAGRVFYVSAGSVYVWTSTGTRRWPGAAPRPDPAGPLSAVFRLPLDGSAPTGLKTAGVPVDQMSFLEDGAFLNVLVREQGAGEGMFGGERGRGALALLRAPLAAFGDGRGAAAIEHYRRLPGSSGGALQNRYVGDWLVWGGAEGAWAVRPADGAASPSVLQPGHAVERIEALGAQALLVGNAGGDLVFSGVRLAGREARLEGRHVQRDARQGETRTHGFFYRATGADEGLLGLPVVGAGGEVRPGLGARGGSASVVFLRTRGLSLTGLGELAAQGRGPVDDGCRASCVDWYGNARPLFLGDRVLALLGYEIVEGRLEGGWRGERITEQRRMSFAPVVRLPGGRPSPFND